jgi:hypothetical protein
MPKTETLLVRAAHADRPCPKLRQRIVIDKKTGRDKTMIYADHAEEVPNLRFYRQRIRKGDLILVERVDVSPTPAARVGKGSAASPPGDDR